MSYNKMLINYLKPYNVICPHCIYMYMCVYTYRLPWGGKVAKWLERWTSNQKVQVQIPELTRYKSVVLPPVVLPTVPRLSL